MDPAVRRVRIDELDAYLVAAIDMFIGEVGIDPRVGDVAAGRGDKTKVVGFVASAGETSFAVTDSATGQATDVPYADVSKVRGNNLATGWKIGIGVGIALASRGRMRGPEVLKIRTVHVSTPCWR